MYKRIAAILLSVTGVSLCFGQQADGYPPVLETRDGVRVTTVREWERIRRPEILDLFATQMYGVDPGTKVKTSYRVLEEDARALGGKATRRQVRMTFAANGMERTADMLLYIPNGVRRPVPVIVGLNFQGNYATTSDPAVLMTDRWVPYPKGINRPADSLRGRAASRWPYERAVERGYAVATIFNGDFFSDRREGYDGSVLPMLYAGSTVPDSARMKAVGAWAWGLSRAVDYFEKARELDARRIVLLGHSRLGKAALWAGASDPRFSVVVSNDSGSTGAALARNKRGENVERINRNFPYWFADNYKKYNDNEFALPVDQHLLLALVAPRPLYVGSASRDQWADPAREFGAARLCGDAYRLYGLHPLEWKGEGLPPVNTPLQKGDVAYHLREGKHDITLYDWERYMDFADKYFK